MTLLKLNIKHTEPSITVASLEVGDWFQTSLKGFAGDTLIKLHNQTSSSMMINVWNVTQRKYSLFAGDTPVTYVFDQVEINLS